MNKPTEYLLLTVLTAKEVTTNSNNNHNCATMWSDAESLV